MHTHESILHIQRLWRNSGILRAPEGHENGVSMRCSHAQRSVKRGLEPSE